MSVWAADLARMTSAEEGSPLTPPDFPSEGPPRLYPAVGDVPPEPSSQTRG